MEGVEFRVLGPLEAVRDGELVALGGPKPQAVLALLLLATGRPVRTDALVDALWGEKPPATAVKTLQKYVSLLRAEIGEPDLLVTHADGYALAVAPEKVDVRRFERGVDEAADAEEPARAAALLEQALALWRGEPFAEVGDVPAAVAERTRLAERRLQAIEGLADAQLALGQHARLVGRLEELVAAHPLRERFWGRLMLALYRCGRQADALDAYRRLRTSLADQLGIDPSLPLRQLEERILRQDPRLDAPAAAVAGPGEVPASNLPVQLSSFVGRQAELAELDALLTDRRLVTLLGPAGSGKTRLAIEAANRGIEHHADGVWFVDFSPLRSPDEIPTAVADPFGVKGRPGRPVESVLVDHLATRQLQLVLDNCEHLVDDVARLITRLLRSAPALRVLATSREPLGVEGETTFEVPPLPIPDARDREHVRQVDAVRLFVERSQAVDRDFELTSENGPAVADICRHLDGLPLALEIAAARVRTFTPEEIADLLDDRFSVLRSPARTAPARHQTLQAAVDWSYDLLTAEERTLFTRLSVFRGGFDLEAAGEVCCTDPLGPGDARFLLPELVDKSLVVTDRRSDGQTRFRLLETLREYGRDRLDGSAATAVRDAHTTYFCALATRAAPHIRGPEQQHWIRRLSVDYDNLRNALRWAFSQHPEMGIRLAIALADYWDAVGPRTEAHEWLRRAVELTETGHRHLYIPVRLAASDLFVSTHLSHSMRFAEEALVEAERTGDERFEAAALRARGWARALQGDFEVAIASCERALRIWRRLDDPWETAWTLERLAQSNYRHPDRSLQRYGESLNLFRQVGDRRRAGMVLYKMAEAGLRDGSSLETIEEWVRESLAIFDAMGSTHDSAHALLELGKIKRRQARPDEALEILEMGLERMRMVGDQRCTARTLTALGIALIDAGDHARAWDVLRQSLQIGRALNERQTLRVTLAGMAKLCTVAQLWRDAATLTAVVNRVGRESGLRVTETTAARRREFLDTIREALEPIAFDEAWKAGEAMAAEDSVEVALGMPTPPFARSTPQRTRR